MKNPAAEQIRYALMVAMESRAAFSWLRTQDVQEGVYVKHTQQFFSTYRMK